MMAWEKGCSCEFIKKACKQHETSYKVIALDKIVMAQGKSNATLLNCWSTHLLRIIFGELVQGVIIICSTSANPRQLVNSSASSLG